MYESLTRAGSTPVEKVWEEVPPVLVLVLCAPPGPPLMMVLLPSGPMMVPELTAHQHDTRIPLKISYS